MSIKLTGATSGSIELDVPAAVSGGDISLTLPNGVGSSNQVLKNGSTAGTLEFAEGGKILQVKSTVKTNAFSSNSSSFVDITGLSVSITPSSTSSKILVFSNFSVSGDTWDSGRGIAFNLVRDSTNICQGTGASSTNATTGFNSWANNQGNTVGNHSSVSIQFLDSPSTTSATTYKIQGKHTYTVGTLSFYVGRVHVDDSLAFASVITAMEVSA